MNRLHRRTQTILIALLLCLPLLACWSSDTLFIKLTATPVPTLTPTPQAINSKYKVGDNVTIASQGLFGAVYLTTAPEPETRSNRVEGAVCNPGTPIPIQSVQQVGGVTYYQVECNNATGWTAESNLAPMGS